MRLPGWCERCARIRCVRVRIPLALTPIGICQECEDAEDHPDNNREASR